jgi:hypothetical protein
MTPTIVKITAVRLMFLSMTSRQRAAILRYRWSDCVAKAALDECVIRFLAQ